MHFQSRHFGTIKPKYLYAKTDPSPLIMASLIHQGDSTMIVPKGNYETFSDRLSLSGLTSENVDYEMVDCVQY